MWPSDSPGSAWRARGSAEWATMRWAIWWYGRSAPKVWREAALLLGRVPEDLGTPTFDMGEELARAVAETGPRTVVVKLGALGSLALDGDRIYRAEAVPVAVVDAVGAGDAFVAGYLSGVV